MLSVVSVDTAHGQMLNLTLDEFFTENIYMACPNRR